MAVEPRAQDKWAGRVLTPAPLAEALCRWAIRARGATVLDLGVGEGAFLVAAIRRLRELGATRDDVAASLHGAELDARVYDRAREAVLAELGVPLPSVVRGDFHTTPLPCADAIVGNPPYIRRHYQSDPHGHRAAAGVPAADGMTDAYCYFLLRACQSLRPGGRMAVVVSASWLDMRYGERLKAALLAEDLDLRLILGFDGRVFSTALVKPVILLVERAPARPATHFARLEPGTELADLASSIDNLSAGHAQPGVALHSVPRTALAPRTAWSSLLRSAEGQPSLLSTGRWVPLREIADSRIGLQTFAKPFYVLARDEAARRGIEPAYLLPLAFSPRDVQEPVLGAAGDTRHVVFACDRPLAELHGTGAAAHIVAGMSTPVPIRGTTEIVPGYHRAPRLLRAGRDPWYNLRTEIARRGSWPILIPRRTFVSFLVVHNRAGAVANEDFLEARPRDPAHVEPLLAVLNASIGEFLLRSQAFQYGGGVFNLNPGALRALPVPDLSSLTAGALQDLAGAWRAFAAANARPAARVELSTTVSAVLGVRPETQTAVDQALDRLVRSTRAAVVLHGRERQLALLEQGRYDRSATLDVLTL